ncbi:MAG: hypothetical protein SVW77_03855 [Candidatus Nanohaloarchaea archaeon]|nr:hypothetical protein [Candidatus Nanohaloarchaea archaeon]
MTHMDEPGACDNCGTDLAEVDDPVTEGNHEFCSTDCRDEYNEEHDHADDGEEEAEVCEFC